MTGELLEPVPHCQLVWTIPRVLRPAFRRDRKLLGELRRSAWLCLRQYFRPTLGSDTLPAAVFAIQTYGDQLNFHPHLHSLVAEGAWSRDDLTFQPIQGLDSDILTTLFRQQVLERMVARRRLSPAFAHKISHWRAWPWRRVPHRINSRPKPIAFPKPVAKTGHGCCARSTKSTLWPAPAARLP